MREEFDLPARLEVGDVLSATGEASCVRVDGRRGAHRRHAARWRCACCTKPQEAGDPLVMTSHELPFELSIDAQIRRKGRGCTHRPRPLT